MPKKFKFYKVQNGVQEVQPSYQCELHSERCLGYSKNGVRCKRRCIIGFEYCFQHMQSIKHLKIRPTTLPGFTFSGLFAWDPSAVGPIFRNEDVVCKYFGDVVEPAIIQEHYGNSTAPYAFLANKNRAVDCACRRGIGALANTSAGHNNCRFSVSNANGGSLSIKATKNIYHGQELFVPYGNKYHFHDHEHTTK